MTISKIHTIKNTLSFPRFAVTLNNGKRTVEAVVGPSQEPRTLANVEAVSGSSQAPEPRTGTPKTDCQRRNARRRRAKTGAPLHSEAASPAVSVEWQAVRSSCLQACEDFVQSTRKTSWFGSFFRRLMGNDKPPTQPVTNEYRQTLQSGKTWVANPHQLCAESRRELEKIAIERLVGDERPIIHVGAAQSIQRNRMGRKFFALSPIIDGADHNRNCRATPEATVCHCKLRDCKCIPFESTKAQYLFTHSIYHMKNKDLNRMCIGSSGYIIMHVFDGEHGCIPANEPEAYWDMNGNNVTMTMAKGIGTTYNHPAAKWVTNGGMRLENKSIVTSHLRSLHGTHLFRFEVVAGKPPFSKIGVQSDRTKVYTEAHAALICVQNKGNVSTYLSAATRVASQLQKKHGSEYTTKFIVYEVGRACSDAIDNESEILHSYKSTQQSENNHRAALLQLDVEDRTPGLSPASKLVAGIGAVAGAISIVHAVAPYFGYLVLAGPVAWGVMALVPLCAAALLWANWGTTSILSRWFFRSSI